MRDDLVPRLIAIFVREATSRLLEMDHYLGVLEREPGDRAALLALTHRFHSFAGVGGVEGFDLVNSLGERGESEGRRILAHDCPPCHTEILAWRAMVDGLADQVRMLRGVGHSV